ncbi:MAG: DUF2911 domain-containing protein [Myxococcota bacterium]
MTIACILSLSVLAQPELPQPSPAASVSQTVGLTTVSVDYSSPAKRGRVVWGELVPYGELWRTGANRATTLAVDKDVSIEGQTVPAGTYALYTIPDEDAWTVIVNRNAGAGGTNGYTEEKDVARFVVEPSEGPALERMRFVFTDTDASKSSLHLEWDGLRISMRIAADTEAHVEANIASAVASAWRPHVISARYLLENDGDLQRALELAESSIGIKEGWFNRWIQARVLHGLGKDRDARKQTKRALALGDDSGAFNFYSRQMKQALTDWK